LAFTYLKVKSAKFLGLLSVVLVLRIWSCLHHWSSQKQIAFPKETRGTSALVRKWKKDWFKKTECMRVYERKERIGLSECRVCYPSVKGGV